MKSDVVMIITRKPKPDKILSIIKKLKIKKDKTVYVGDMMVDKLTAKNAGVDFIHALYGYSSKKLNTKIQYIPLKS